jgi:hypothetical protein
MVKYGTMYNIVQYTTDMVWWYGTIHVCMVQYTTDQGIFEAKIPVFYKREQPVTHRSLPAVQQEFITFPMSYGTSPWIGAKSATQS